jgi:hypothetical protein
MSDWSSFSVDLIRKLEALGALEVHLPGPSFDRLRDDIAKRRSLTDEARRGLDWVRIGCTRVVRRAEP